MKLSRKTACDYSFEITVGSRGLTAQKMKFSIKYFSSKCDQICRKLRIWSHLLEKSLMENFIFCAVSVLLEINVLSLLANLTHKNNFGFTEKMAWYYLTNLVQTLYRFLKRLDSKIIKNKSENNILFRCYFYFIKWNIYSTQKPTWHFTVH